MRNLNVAFIVIILSAEFHLKSLYLQSVLKVHDSYTRLCQWILRHYCLFFHGYSDIWHQLRAEQSKLPRKTFDSSSSSSFGHLDTCPDVPSEALRQFVPPDLNLVLKLFGVQRF